MAGGKGAAAGDTESRIQEAGKLEGEFFKEDGGWGMKREIEKWWRGASGGGLWTSSLFHRWI